MIPLRVVTFDVFPLDLCHCRSMRCAATSIMLTFIWTLNPQSCDHFRRHGDQNFGTGDLIWKIVAKLVTREKLKQHTIDLFFITFS